MRILILGGSGSGKSRYAEQIVTQFPQTRRIYFATMQAIDEEDQQRILNHQKQRADLHFETIEATHSLAQYHCKDACVLVDSVTSLVSYAMFSKNQLTQQEIIDDCLHIDSEVVIFVSDFCFSEGIHDEFTQKWKRMLAHVHQGLAQSCDVVVYINAGIAKIVKGETHV